MLFTAFFMATSRCNISFGCYHHPWTGRIVWNSHVHAQHLPLDNVKDEIPSYKTCIQIQKVKKQQQKPKKPSSDDIRYV